MSAIVIHGGSGRTLVPWEIFQSHVDSITVQEFCDSFLFPKMPMNYLSQVQVFLIQCSDVLSVFKRGGRV